MAKQTILDEVKDHMRELQELKSADLETIEQKLQEAGGKLAAAELDMRRATEVMDADAYADAEEARRKAKTLLSMYNGRYEQIRQQEYISESESDKTIDRLLGYEKGLEAGFKAEIAGLLKQLAQAYEKYSAEVKATEDALTAWQLTIHANYRSEGTIYKETGTNRSLTPVPVHRLGYEGCREAVQLRDYLEKAEELYKG